MADTKISELPIATAVASPDVAPIVQGGVTKKADVSLFIGSFPSTNCTRVDPLGNDATGIIGNLTKPFLTVQAAIDAFEASPPDHCVIDIGTNTFQEDVVVTNLASITFTGLGYFANQAIAFASLSFTGVSLEINVQNCLIGNIIANASAQLAINIEDNGDTNDITNTGGPISVQSFGGSGVVGGTISCPGFPIEIYNFNNNNSDELRIDSTGSDITAVRTRIRRIANAANVHLIDSRFIPGNTFNISGTLTYSDIFFRNVPAGTGEDQGMALLSNGATDFITSFPQWGFPDPLLMDFSTLPQQTDDTGLSSGQAWIDITADLNIVKVKL